MPLKVYTTAVQLALAICIVLEKGISLAEMLCPGEEQNSVWPEGQHMFMAKVPAETATDADRAVCCLQPWSSLNNEQGNSTLNFENNTAFVCSNTLSAGNDEGAENTSRLKTGADCLATSCNALGPPQGQICCEASRDYSVPISQEIYNYHKVPWVPVDICASNLSEEEPRLLGYHLDSQETLECPKFPHPGSSQEVVFGSELEPAFQDSGIYVVTFHRKLQLTSVQVSFEVTDAQGRDVVPFQSLALGADGGKEPRRRLLRRSSYGGGRSSGSRSSSGSWSAGGGGGYAGSGSSAGGTSPAGSPALSRGAAMLGGQARRANTKGYAAPQPGDFASGAVSRGTTVASTSGGGVQYWGSKPSVIAGSSSSRRYYGAPAGFGSSWYSNNYRNRGYGYSGLAVWSAAALPILLWSRPFRCGYHCHYHRRPYRANETLGEASPEEDEASRVFQTLYIPCEMGMDLLMDTAFERREFALPLTVKISELEAAFSADAGSCEGGQDLAANETSRPDSPALFVTFSRVDEVLLDSEATRFARWYCRMAFLIAGFVSMVA